MAAAATLAEVSLELAQSHGAPAPIAVAALKRFLALCSCSRRIRGGDDDDEGHESTETVMLGSLCADVDACVSKHPRADIQSKGCLLEQFVLHSPQCFELFRIWGGVDPLLATTLPSILSGGPIQPFALDATRKKAEAQKITILRYVMECFATIMEHRQLDVMSVAKIRATLSHQFITSCRRPFYRVLQCIDLTKKLPCACARLLCRLQDPETPWSPAYVSQLLANFNFALNGFQKLGDPPVPFEPTKLRQQLRAGEALPADSGLFGHIPLTAAVQQRQRACRRWFLKFFCQLFQTGQPETTVHVLTVHHLLNHVTRYLPMDDPRDVFLVLETLERHVLRSESLTLSAKTRLCRPGVLSHLALLTGVYDTAVMCERQALTTSPTPPSHQSRSEPSMIAGVADQLHRILLFMFGGDGILRRVKTPGVVSSLVAETCLALPSIHVPAQQELAFQILEAHPTSHEAVFTRLRSLMSGKTLHPRPCFLWFSYAALVYRLLQLPVALEPVTLQRRQQPRVHASDCQQLGCDGTDDPDVNDVVRLCQEMSAVNNSDAACSGVLAETDGDVRTTWSSRVTSLRDTSRLFARVMSQILLGMSPLLTRQTLTACLMTPSPPIVYIALVLIQHVCRRVHGVVRSLIAQQHVGLARMLQHAVALQLPDMGTMIAVLTSLGKTTGSFMTYIPGGKGLAASLPCEDVGTSTTPCRVAAWSRGAYYDEQIPFDVQLRHELKRKRAASDSTTLVDDDIELPGITNDTTSRSEDDDNTQNTSSPRRLLDLASQTFSLNDALAVVGWCDMVFGTRDDNLRELSKDVFATVAPPCLFSTWCKATFCLLSSLSLNPLQTKFAWNRLLAFCWPPMPAPSSALLSPPVRDGLSTALCVVCVLDVAWSINCCPITMEQPPCPRRSDGEDGPYTVLESHLSKYHMLWVERVLDLYGYVLRSMGFPPSEPPSSNEALRTTHVFCRVSLERFLEKSQFCRTTTGSDVQHWIESIDTVSANSFERGSFVLLFLGVLKNLMLHFPAFMEAFQTLDEDQAMHENNDAHEETNVMLRPLSPLSMAMLMHWFETPPEALPPRYLHLDLPQVSFCESHNVRDNPEATETCCTLMCDTLSHCVQTATTTTPSAAAALLQRYCRAGEWRDIFATSSFTTTTTQVAMKKSSKVVKRINRQRLRLMAMEETPGTATLSPMKQVLSLPELPQRRRHSAVALQETFSNKVATSSCVAQLPTLAQKTHSSEMTVHQNMTTLRVEGSFWEWIVALAHDAAYQVEAMKEHQSLAEALPSLVQAVRSLKPRDLVEGLAEQPFASFPASLDKALHDLDTCSSSSEAVVLYVALLDLAEQIAGGTVDAETTLDLPNIIHFWLNLLAWYDVFARKTTSGETKKGWTRHKTKLKSLASLVGHFYVCPFLLSQVPHQFPAARKVEHPLTPSQTSIIRHVGTLALLRAHLSLVSSGATSDTEQAAPTLSEGLPEEWVDALMWCYAGSLSLTDRLVRLVIQDPHLLCDVPLQEWICYLYDFTDARPATPPKSWSAHPVDWLHLDHQRCLMTRNFFPFSRQFAPDLRQVRSSIFNIMRHREVGLADDNAEVPDYVTAVEWDTTPHNRGGQGHRSVCSTTLYDPANILPYLASRLRAAWMIVDEQRRPLQGRPPGPLYDLLREDEPEASDSKDDATAKSSLHQFAASLDREGRWLRRVASGGALELLFLGLACQDPCLRRSALDGLAYYRALLVAAEDDAQYEAAKQRRQRVWKLAVRKLKSQQSKTVPRDPVTKKKEIRKEYETLLPQERLVVNHSFKESRELLTLLELLKSSIEKTTDEVCQVSVTPKTSALLQCTPQLTAPLAIAAVLFTPILLEPAHPLYLTVNRYLSSRYCCSSQEAPLLTFCLWPSCAPAVFSEHLLFGLTYLRLMAQAIAAQTCDADTWKQGRQVWDILLRKGAIGALMGMTSMLPFNDNAIARSVWNTTMVTLLTLARSLDHQITFWLVKQYGLLDWVQAQLCDVGYALRSDNCHDSIQLSKGTPPQEDAAQKLQMMTERLEALIVLLCRITRHPSFSQHTVDMNNKRSAIPVQNAHGNSASREKLLEWQSSWQGRRAEHILAFAFTLLERLQLTHASYSNEDLEFGTVSQKSFDWGSPTKQLRELQQTPNHESNLLEDPKDICDL